MRERQQRLHATRTRRTSPSGSNSAVTGSAERGNAEPPPRDGYRRYGRARTERAAGRPHELIARRSEGDPTRPAALPAPLGSASTAREAPSVPRRSVFATPAAGAERPRANGSPARTAGGRSRAPQEGPTTPNPKRTSSPGPSSAAGLGRTPPLRSVELVHRPRHSPPRPSRPAQQRPQGGAITALGCRAQRAAAELS